MRDGGTLFRVRSDHDHSPVTYIELFFDLVFVFAITQLSHRLLEHLSLIGAMETLILLLAVWWVWIHTSWTTNWLDPERAQVRLMLILLMMLGLVLSGAIPGAFGARSWLFAAAYCAMQLFRSLYTVWASWGIHQARARNFQRISFWFLLAVPLWAAGAFTEGAMRLLCWMAALGIEYAGPYMLFRTPGLGRSSAADWDISGGHMAERCALFIIIALGESVLVTGATFAKLPQDTLHWLAFATSFVGTAALWWIYFDHGARRGAERMQSDDNAGLLARNAYTYWHIPIVAGVIVSAVGDELLLMHPVGHSDRAMLMTMIGGPSLFLLGNMGFKWVTSAARFPPFSHGVGLVLLLGISIAAYGLHWQPITTGLAVIAALFATAIWEWGSYHGGWRRWAPGLGRLFGAVP